MRFFSASSSSFMEMNTSVYTTSAPRTAAATSSVISTSPYCIARSTTARAGL